MLGSKTFEADRRTSALIELTPRLRKEQLACEAEQGLTAAPQFYALAV